MPVSQGKQKPQNTYFHCVHFHLSSPTFGCILPCNLSAAIIDIFLCWTRCFIQSCIPPVFFLVRMQLCIAMSSGICPTEPTCFMIRAENGEYDFKALAINLGLMVIMRTMSMVIQYFTTSTPDNFFMKLNLKLTRKMINSESHRRVCQIISLQVHIGCSIISAAAALPNPLTQ